ncbi:MAG: hypothetical protein LBU83_01350 [Bacteroidales bacterium]|jgi:hypothetical protein|nr:hypothetical protein [Bacteroidales bacterium]
MKKNLFLFFIVLFSHLLGSAQSNNEVTVLFLLPFHLKDGSTKYLSIKSSAEIHQIKQFEMIGFWFGAKMALKEYENADMKINVIVRDVVTDESELKIILEDSLLMKQVDIIIGPFYGSLFPIASDFAKKNKIIIVNPFSTRYDFVENNPYVFKLIPPFISRPETIENYFLSHSEDYDIILWGDSTTTPELIAYKYFFNEHHIRFKEIHTLTLPQHSLHKKLIIALFDERERVIHGVHSITSLEDQTNRVFVVPEKWLSVSELTEDFYSLPELFFFSNYFIDENSPEIQQFKEDYIFNYGAPAELADYSFQGYDITRYFIDLFFADFNTNDVQFKPLSYKFQWKQILNGGFENSKARLIKIKDLELEEVNAK